MSLEIIVIYQAGQTTRHVLYHQVSHLPLALLTDLVELPGQLALGIVVLRYHSCIIPNALKLGKPLISRLRSVMAKPHRARPSDRCSRQGCPCWAASSRCRGRDSFAGAGRAKAMMTAGTATILGITGRVEIGCRNSNFVRFGSLS